MTQLQLTSMLAPVLQCPAAPLDALALPALSLAETDDVDAAGLIASARWTWLMHGFSARFLLPGITLEITDLHRICSVSADAVLFGLSGPHNSGIHSTLYGRH